MFFCQDWNTPWEERFFLRKAQSWLVSLSPWEILSQALQIQVLLAASAIFFSSFMEKQSSLGHIYHDGEERSDF